MGMEGNAVSRVFNPIVLLFLSYGAYHAYYEKKGTVVFAGATKLFEPEPGSQLGHGHPYGSTTTRRNSGLEGT